MQPVAFSCKKCGFCPGCGAWRMAESAALLIDAVFPEQPTPAERHAAMIRAQRLKRVFGIDIETCPACGGAMRIIACTEYPDVIEKILTHLDAKGSEPETPLRPLCRAPPQRRLFD
jgi:hypothetical protein